MPMRTPSRSISRRGSTALSPAADPADDLSALVGTGWLQKQESDIAKGWKQRHFRLERLDDAEGGAWSDDAFNPPSIR